MKTLVKKVLLIALALSSYEAAADEIDQRLSIAQAVADAALRETVLNYTSMRSPLVKGRLTLQKPGSSEKTFYDVIGRDDLHLKLIDPVANFTLTLEIARKFDEPQILFRTFSNVKVLPLDSPGITRVVLDPPDAEFPLIRSIDFTNIELVDGQLSGEIIEVPQNERTYEFLLDAEKALLHPIYGHCMISDCLLESEKEGRVSDVGDKRIVNSDVKQRVIKKFREVAQPDECPSAQPIKECTERFQFSFEMTLPKSDLNASSVEVSYVGPANTTCECLPM
jgi:hypothetical protein